MENTNFSRLKKYLPDGFIAGIMGMIFLAWLIPGIGGNTYMIHLKDLIRIGIALLFFFYGLRLSPENLKNDLKNWRLHLVVQSITFLVFPLLILLFRPFLKGTENEVLWLAVFFLAALPSTVSSSVVMVSIAEGNIPSAIFNASISGVIGILITPMWMGIFLEKQDAAFAFSDVLADLVIHILIPVVLGLLLHRFWGNWASRNKRYLSFFDKSVILCIVYQSFSDSFLNRIFSSVSWTELIFLSGSIIALFFVVFNLTKSITKLMKFNREDSITVLFCGSKKSLVHGSVMASVIFAGSTTGGIFLVPIMIYHAFQLFYISVVARRYSKNKSVNLK
ncbi:MAG: bile acid:sodium symporter family protein [Prolixibacteraceae bacterium]|jgi:sodium/bile acid cotransporter 7